MNNKGGPCPGGHIRVQPRADQAQIRNNILFPIALICLNGTPPADGVVLSNNLHGIDPLVTNATTGDFRLRAGSPAINTGFNLAGIVTKDFFGAPRPVAVAWDIGAHEFGGVITCPTGDCEPPSVPTNVVLSLISSTAD